MKMPKGIFIFYKQYSLIYRKFLFVFGIECVNSTVNLKNKLNKIIAMRIYVSGIHSALELDRSIEERRKKNASIVICTCENVLKRIKLLKECDTVLFVDGWEFSKFSSLEMSVAQMNDMDIVYQHPDQNCEFLF